MEERKWKVRCYTRQVVWEALSYLSPVWKPRGCGRLGNVGERGDEWVGREGAMVRWYRMGQVGVVAMGATDSMRVADGCDERFLGLACSLGLLLGYATGDYSY